MWRIPTYQLSTKYLWLLSSKTQVCTYSTSIVALHMRCTWQTLSWTVLAREAVEIKGYIKNKPQSILISYSCLQGSIKLPSLSLRWASVISLFLQLLPVSHSFLPLHLPQRVNWSNVVALNWKPQRVFLPQRHQRSDLSVSFLSAYSIYLSVSLPLQCLHLSLLHRFICCLLCLLIKY